jgi:WD40 repeat protein
MPHVFISYSRKDGEFAHALHEALAKENRDSWIDWQDIPLTSDWWQEICTGIEGADAFVSVISPHSIASPVCNLEIAHARQHNKRLIPVLRSETDEKAAFAQLAAMNLDDLVRDALDGRDILAVARDNWHALTRHNWPFFGEGADFTDLFYQLLKAIDTDLDHVRDHTRILVRAREWEGKGRDPSFLLTGNAIAEAEAWLVQAVGKDPPPTALHVEFISTSSASANRRQRRLLTLISVALVVTLALAGLSFALFQQSENRREESNQRGTAVAYQAATATYAQGEAEANLLQAWDTQSLFLADLAQQTLFSGAPQIALQLALESLSHYEDGVYNSTSGEALKTILASRALPVAYIRRENTESDQQGGILPTGKGLNGASTNSDGTRILSWFADGQICIWNLNSGQLILSLSYNASVSDAAWNSDETRVLATFADGTVQVWDAVTGDLQLTLVHDSQVIEALWSKNEDRILTWSDDKTIRIWDAHSGHQLHSMHFDTNIGGAVWNADGTRVLGWGSNFTEPTGRVSVWDSNTGALVFTDLHISWVSGASWNPSEDRILVWGSTNAEVCGTGGCKYDVRVLDGTTGHEVYALPHDTSVEGARWSPDGNSVLTWAGSLIHLWDATSGQETLTLQDDGWVVDASWILERDDSTRVHSIAAWSMFDQTEYSETANTINIWALDSSELIHSLVHDGPTFGAAISPDQTRLVAWGIETDYVENSRPAIWVWDVQTGELLLTIPSETLIADMMWSHDGSKFIGLGEDNSITVWDTKSQFPPLVLPVRGAIWSSDTTRALGIQDTSAYVWDTNTGSTLLELAHDEDVAGAVWSPDGKYILSWHDRLVHIWDSSTGQKLHTLVHDTEVSGLEPFRDGTRLITWSRPPSDCEVDCPYSLSVWDIVSGDMLYTATHDSEIVQAAWNRQGSRFLTLDRDSRVVIWDAQMGNALHTFVHKYYITGAIWNPDGIQVLAWGNETQCTPLCAGAAHVWDSDSGESLHVYTHENAILGATWNPEGTKILTWSLDGTARVWEANHEPLILQHDAPVRHAVWHSANMNIMTLDANGVIRIWKAATGLLMYTYDTGYTGLYEATWSADSSLILAAASSDIYIYNAETLKLLMTVDPMFQGNEARPVGQACPFQLNTRGDRLLVYGSVIWTVDVDELLNIARRYAVRPLTAEERVSFFLPPDQRDHG